jgi:hypothetical protein
MDISVTLDGVKNIVYTITGVTDQDLEGGS